MQIVNNRAINQILIIGFLITFVSGCTDSVEKVRQGKSCVGCDLRGADLSGISLVGVDLSESDLSGANLTDVKIGEGTKFRNANLSGARLENAEIRGGNAADEIGKNMGVVEAEHIFDTTNLSNANLENAKIYTVAFDGSNLSSANLSSIQAGTVRFRDVNLKKANLENAKIIATEKPRKVSIYHPETNEPLAFDDFIETSIFRESDLSGSNLSNVDASEVTFERVNFTDATLVNFQSGNISNPIFPSIDNPEKVLSELNLDLRRAVKSNRAEDMLFDAGLGMTYEVAGKVSVEEVVRGARGVDIFKLWYLLYRDMKSSDERYYGKSAWQLLQRAFDSEVWFDSKSISEKICDLSPDQRRSKYSEDISDKGDQELFLMIVDHAEQTDGDCQPDGVKTISKALTTLEYYVFDYYNDLIDMSGIRECKEPLSNPEDALATLRRSRGNLSSPESSLRLSILSQSVPQYIEQLNNFNSCADLAYSKFSVGVETLQESFIRVMISLNEDVYLAAIAKQSAENKAAAARKRYTDKLYSLTRNLYDVDDLIPEEIKIEGLLSLQAKGTDIARTGGDVDGWIASRMKQKVSSFQRSMNECLMFNYYGERDEKERSEIIKKFQSAVNEKYSDTDLTARMKTCAYNANVAFLTR